MALNQLISAAGSAIFNRTYLLEKETFNGIPRVLIVFDVITSETPTFEANVTENAVEEGPEVSDHIQLKNPRLELQGTVSQTPLDLNVSVANLVAGAAEAATSSQFRSNFLNTGLQQVAGVASAALLGNAANPASGLQAGLADALARSLLLSAYERRARFDVITRRQRYEDMVIQKMTFPRNSNTGNQLVFQLDLKRIRLVRPFIVRIDTVNEDVTTSAVDSADLGKQATKPLNAATETAANRSIFARIDDFTGNKVSGTLGGL